MHIPILNEEHLLSPPVAHFSRSIVYLFGLTNLSHSARIASQKQHNLYLALHRTASPILMAPSDHPLCLLFSYSISLRISWALQNAIREAMRMQGYKSFGVCGEIATSVALPACSCGKAC